MAYAHNLNYVVINSLEPLWTIVLTILLKVYSNELFLFQLTNDLCTSFTKNCNYFIFK